MREVPAYEPAKRRRFAMMRSAPRKFLLLASCAVASGTLDRRAISSPDVGVPSPDIPVPGGRETTRVPLGRRLADALSDRGERTTTVARRRRRRRLEIEVETDDDDPDATDETTTTTTTLVVEEVTRAAITSETTYGFRPGRDFDRSKIEDFSILASDPEEEAFAILSVNESSGDVRGIRRGGRGGRAHRISADSRGRNLRLERMGRSLEEAREGRKWSCGAEHAHDDDGNDRVRSGEHPIFGEGGDQSHRLDHHHKQHHDHARSIPSNAEFARSGYGGRDFALEDGPPGGGGGGGEQTSSPMWIKNPSPNYSFQVDLAIDIDRSFVEKQGSAEAAVEYLNVLVSAANMVFEHEVDAHLNIVHIQETDIYDDLETTKEALREMRLHPKPYPVDGDDSRVILHHAMLGRFMGGGIAFIDTVCDERWAYGVTSDVSGSLRDINELVLFDLFIIAHELGHSLGSGHTFDAYDPPVDGCGACIVEQQGGGGSAVVEVEGLPRESSATLMSYCNFCAGGLSNVALTLGGAWDGVEPRTDLNRWENHPDVVGEVSVEPRRVSHNVWGVLSSKGECARPPVDPLPVRGCNDDGDCDDANECTIDACGGPSNLCAVVETLDDCCGNGRCEAGESLSCSDCGPFHVTAPSLCERDSGCHELDGFMIDIGLSDDAPTRIFVASVSLAYSSPKNDGGATVDVYVTNEGSYVGKEKSATSWERIATTTVPRYNQKRETRTVEIPLDPPVPVGFGERCGFYFAASEDVVLFDERPYSVRNERGVELRSSLAVAGLFGDGIDGFSLSCEVNYMLDVEGPGDVSGLRSRAGQEDGSASPPTASPLEG